MSAPTVKELQAAIGEDLHPDLEPYLVTEDGLPTMLKHPLVYSICPVNGWVNREYEYKTKELAKAVAAKDVETAVWLHERPYRLNAFITYVLQGDLRPLVWEPEWVRRLAAEVWVDTENVEEMGAEWSVLFDGACSLMLFRDHEDTVAFDALPSEFTVWRGAHPDREYGWSWTTNRKTAEWFANRAHGEVLTRQAKRSEVFGCFAGRGESEVLLP